MKTTLEFGEWLPDKPDFANPGALKAKNVIAKPGYYAPFRGLTAFSDALPSRSYGAAAFRQSDGTVHNFAGTSTALYKLSSALWGDATRTVGGAYATPTEGRWTFLVFGNNVLASNGTDAVQRYEMGVDSKFSDLAGSPPSYRYGAIVREFAVVGNIGTTNFSRFQWCDQNDITDWASGQAGSKDIPSGGDIQGIVGGEYGLVFQERQISRLDYVGLPTVWQLDVIEENRGALAPGSIARHGSLTFFLSDDGFYVCDGTQALPVGDEKVDETVLDDFDENYRHRVVAAVDPINKIYVMAYPGAGNTLGRPNKLAVCSYKSGYRWTCVELDVDYVYPSLTDSLTLEGIGVLYSSLDDLPFPLDSRAWQGNSLILSGFGPDFKGGHFSGDTLEAVLETSEVRLNPAGRTFISNTRPLVDAEATIRVGGRERQADTPTYTDVSTMNAFGENPVEQDQRFQRVEMTIAAGTEWKRAQGVEVIHTHTGEY